MPNKKNAVTRAIPSRQHFFNIFKLLILLYYPNRSRRQRFFLAAVKTHKQSAYLVYADAVHFLGNLIVSDLDTRSYNV